MNPQWDLPDCYPTAPTSKQLDVLKRRRQLALDTPLERGTTLELTSPSLYPDSVAQPLDTPPQSYRRRIPDLLSPRGPARSPTQYDLRLVEPLRVGICRSQVWRAIITPLSGAKAEFHVVLKLWHEALFEFSLGIANPPADDWDWRNARWLCSKEAAGYTQLNSLQGSDIPTCYGIYEFFLPCREKAFGIILEDLTESTRPLEAHIRLELTELESELSKMDALVSAVFHVLRRIHQLGLSCLNEAFSFQKVLIFKASSPDNPRIVVYGFEETMPAAEMPIIPPKEFWQHPDPLIRRLRLRDQWGKKVDLKHEFRDAEVVGFLFGASWSGKSRDPYAIIESFAKRHPHQLKIIYCSVDTTESDYLANTKGKPWLSMEWDDGSNPESPLAPTAEPFLLAHDPDLETSNEVPTTDPDCALYLRPYSRVHLAEKFQVLGIPNLVVYHLGKREVLSYHFRIDKLGNAKTGTGGEGVFEKWRKGERLDFEFKDLVGGLKWTLAFGAAAAAYLVAVRVGGADDVVSKWTENLTKQYFGVQGP
ncbi:thioredoxin fold domain protein [Pseudohyphozyma bogoriensis]|nr:thioredoxin fold domain protein [Pseudohyphozyma bogoriensis]